MDLNEAKHVRAERVLNRRMWSKLRAIGINFGFACVAFITAFTYNDPHSYMYKEALSKMLTAKRPGCISLDEVCLLFLDYKFMREVF
jgi:hypothetical protein